jgi:hypothetical protein
MKELAYLQASKVALEEWMATKMNATLRAIVEKQLEKVNNEMAELARRAA